MGKIRVGIAGWDYPDWQGTVYPAGPPRLPDRLAYAARFVDAIEINSTFYRPVAPRVAASWVQRTRDLEDFRFTAKAHRSWTHDAAIPSASQIHETLDGLRPIADAGRLGALLVQFPQSFHFDADALLRLERIHDTSAGWPLAVEVRHASWADESAQDWLRERAIAWCAVDQPQVGSSGLGTLARVTAPRAYLRMHGRNSENWFRRSAGRDERYDYLYAGHELDRLAAVAREMGQRAEELFVIQNNHFRGKALANALQMMHRLGRGRPEAPEELVLTYPELEPDVRVRRTRLF